MDIKIGDIFETEDKHIVFEVVNVCPITPFYTKVKVIVIRSRVSCRDRAEFSLKNFTELVENREFIFIGHNP